MPDDCALPRATSTGRSFQLREGWCSSSSELDRTQGFSALPTAVGKTLENTVVADRGQLMLLAATGVRETPQLSYRNIIRSVIVTTQGVGPEKQHHGLPFMAVGSDGLAVQGAGDQMGDLMGQGLGQKVVPIVLQQDRVVTDHRRFAVWEQHHPCGRAPQIEVNFHCRHGDTIMAFRTPDQCVCLSPGPLQQLFADHWVNSPNRAYRSGQGRAVRSEVMRLTRGFVAGIRVGTVNEIAGVAVRVIEFDFRVTHL